MRILAVRQPWAEAIARGAKDVENRSRGFTRKYRGPVAVLASKQWSARARHDLRVLETFPKGTPHGYALRHVVDYGGRPPYPFASGMVLAVAELVDAHFDVGCCRPWGESEYLDAAGNKATGLVHLRLEDVRRIQPIEATGRLGLLPPDPDLAVEIEEALRALSQSPGVGSEGLR